MKDKPEKEPWPEDMVTSQKTQHIGQTINQLHHHLDQLMEQADLIAAYMPPHPVIKSRPVVTLNASMIVAQKEKEEEALRALRQDIAQKQTDLAANSQNHDNDDKNKDRPSDAQKPQNNQQPPIEEPPIKEPQDNELQALIRAYVKRCLEDEAPRIIRKELLSVLSRELDVPQKRDGKK